MKVPVGSLFRRGNDWAVFAVDEDRAAPRTVSVGHRNNDEAEIVGGLSAGESVVLHPPDTLTTGARVSPRQVE